MEGNDLQEIDRLSSTGLNLAGDRLLRLLRSVDPDSPGELLIYDRRGVERYYRIDELTDPHDILWDSENFVAVSTLSNMVLWISPSGEVVRRWKAPGEGDTWHVNSVLLHEDKLFLSAFGRYQRHREWAEHKDRPTGFLLNLADFTEVLAGLNHPHHPRYFDDAWAVCNSMTNEVLQIDPRTGEIRRRTRLNGYTRGFAVSDDLMFIGESANRREPGSQQTASIAILSRGTWEVLGRVALPCREVYDLLVVRDTHLLGGIRRGFRTNSTRVLEQDQLALFHQVGVRPVRLWAISDPLPPEVCRIRIEASPPTTMEAGGIIEFECLCHSLTGAILISAPPCPVHLSYKWLEPTSGAQLPGIEGLRTTLPRALPPGEDLNVMIRVQAPAVPGEYELRVTMVQEFVAWFDDLDGGNAFSARVTIAGADAA